MTNYYSLLATYKRFLVFPYMFYNNIFREGGEDRSTHLLLKFLYISLKKNLHLQLFEHFKTIYSLKYGVI